MRERLIELLEQARCKTCGKSLAQEDAITADYLLDNGVIVPPCKVGDTVWAVLHNEMLYWDGKPEYQIKVVKFHYGLLHEFGRRVFLTEEEAKAKLKELKGE